MDDRLRRLITLGREHYNAREWDKAERYLAEVVREHHGFADIYNMLGVIYHNQGRFVQAQEAFEAALTINPNYTEAALNLSVTYNDLGKYARAREVYLAAMRRSRGEPRSLDPFAAGKIANMHADVGAAYAGVGLYDDAAVEYKKALELCPGFIDLRTRLAQILRDAGRHEEAVIELEKVKAQNPKYVPARLALGVTLFAMGHNERAAMEWQACLDIDPEHKAARVFLGMVRDQGAGDA